MSILHSLKRRELLKEKAIILAEQMFVTGDIRRHFNFHRADYTKQIGGHCDIHSVFLPKYSSDLNPIVYIWKSIKRVICQSLVHDIYHIRALI